MNCLYDLAAPAKINLFLHIVGRRADGYHRMQSALALIDWQDTLHLEKRPNGAISREDLSVPLPATDLCIKAARALQNATGCTQGAHIAIKKTIPAEAGLGGGSSDAATCLLGLNRLWGLELTRAQLSAIGLGLGADVPFFVGGQNAWVEGIGEELTPIDLPEAQFLVIKPSQGLSTRDIFTSPGLKRDTKPATMRGFATDALFEYGCNDLQATAITLCPEVAQVLTFLENAGLSGRMTGSGSAVFAVIPSHFKRVSEGNTGSIEALQNALAGFQNEHHWQHKVCDSLNQHPLFDWLI